MTPNPVVRVVGSPLAGVEGVVAALRTRLPDAWIVGASEADDRVPDAVLAVVSAVAPVTRSEWVRVEHAAARTGLLIGVVSKIDAHRLWRDVMAANRMRVQRWADRGVATPWVGVAAAPDFGAPAVDDLIAVLRDRLADPDLASRNRPATGASAPVGSAAAELRCALAHTRLRLLRVVRNRTSALRAELRAAASAVPTGGAVAFERTVLARAKDLDDELDAEVGRQVRDVLAAAAGLGLDDLAEPGVRLDPIDVARSASSRRLEGRLTTVLGVGFGLGIALASSRLVAGLAPGLAVAGVVAGAVAGVVLVAWVVRARRLLHDRALLDRWVTEVATTLRWHGEAMVAERLLGAESAWLTAHSRTAAQAPLDGRGVGPKRNREDVTDQYEW